MRKMLVTMVLASFVVAFGACKKKEEQKAPAKKAEPAPATATAPTPPPATEPPKAEPPPAEKSLYERLGGKDAITKVVDDFVANVVADARINKFFAKADAAKLKGHLVDQICEATGGPCKYTGRSMAEAHKGMNITEADFNALVEDLGKALDKNGVPEKEKGELLGALAGMKGDIVGK